MSELVVIGSASATPVLNRFCSAYALVVGPDICLSDCGAPAGTLLYRVGFDPMAIKAFCTTLISID